MDPRHKTVLHKGFCGPIIQWTICSEHPPHRLSSQDRPPPVELVMRKEAVPYVGESLAVGPRTSEDRDWYIYQKPSGHCGIRLLYLVTRGGTHEDVKAVIRQEKSRRFADNVELPLIIVTHWCYSV